jgi:hypothetical protein
MITLLCHVTRYGFVDNTDISEETTASIFTTQESLLL